MTKTHIFIEEKKRSTVERFENKSWKDQNIVSIRMPLEYSACHIKKDPGLSSSLLPAAVEPHQRLLYSLDATPAPYCSYANSLPVYSQPFSQQSISTRQLLTVLSRRVSSSQVNALLALSIRTGQ